MSKRSRRDAKAGARAMQLESALERTERALQAADLADLALNAERGGKKKRSGRFFKLLLVLALGGVAFAVVRRLTSSDAPGSPTPSTPQSEPTSTSPVAGGTPGSNGESPSSAVDDASDSADAASDEDEPST